MRGWTPPICAPCWAQYGKSWTPSSAATMPVRCCARAWTVPSWDAPTGKSTLLNLLAGFDRAIVTPVAGTTRDVVEQAVRWEISG